MKTYVVGGAVRDRLLGLPVIDRDHVVIGATVDQMLAAGFTPVGRDFPVFLHPDTHEEYALARTERKVAPGYAGFVFHADPSVTLEADLERRDLTINAIACDEATGRLIDPFDGRRDLALRVFRHVGPAFAEDPVRLLRIARFAARFNDFAVAPETLDLMRTMTRAGEIDALVPERVWQEVARGLMEQMPSRMIGVLRDSGALRRILPELDGLFADGTGRRLLDAVDRSAAADDPLEVRFAVLLAPLGADRSKVGRPPASAIDALCARLAVPRAARDLANLVAREGETLIDVVAGTGSRLVEAMERSDAFRRRPRFGQVIDAVGRSVDDPVAAAGLTERLRLALEAAAAVDAGAIARSVDYAPALIAGRLHAARTDAVTAAASAQEKAASQGGPDNAIGQ